ncbi:WD40 repeat-like protein [Rhizopogon vinicolor AM-OR11-026]|uniref:WD40 repeat-like protein n=1 Tax=Rhizopogon vinicolor AM-OR11-026 TaxID=1314800 RepID=A0A1B7MLC7_9AGAM|nr:WD40 repeat-like protein [Rhizopogon vinicolor AM-OR11-026]
MWTLDEASTFAQPRPTPKHEFKGHKDDIWSFVFLHDNVHIVSGSEDGTMRKWDCDTGLLVGKPWGSEEGAIYALALSPDGKTISCGRENGSVEMWNTDGKISEDTWTGHSSRVRVLSWSPSGSHIASGSQDGTILFRKTGNGEVEPEVGPIKTQQGGVGSLAYSHSGDKIASGGNNGTICIWNSNTGELLVGRMKNLGSWVESVVWSLDDSKLYSASDEFARVFDSTSGTLLHRFEHTYLMLSVALSPKHNLLAYGTQSHKLLGSFRQEYYDTVLRCVSFSQDGRYLAYIGSDLKIALWMVKDIAPELPVTSYTAGHSMQSPPPSCFEARSSQVDASSPFAQTEGDKITQEGRDNVYDDFFRSSEPSSHFAVYGSIRPRLSRLFSVRRLWNVLIPSRHDQPADQCIPLQPRINRSFFARHTGPWPVTVFAGRPRKLYWMAPRPVVLEDQSAEEENGNTNAQTGQPPSSIAAPPSVAQADSTPHRPQHPQIQPATRPVDEEYDYGCWGNFWYVVCCMSRRPRDISGVQPAAS